VIAKDGALPWKCIYFSFSGLVYLQLGKSVISTQSKTKMPLQCSKYQQCTDVLVIGRYLHYLFNLT